MKAKTLQIWAVSRGSHRPCVATERLHVASVAEEVSFSFDLIEHTRESPCLASSCHQKQAHRTRRRWKLTNWVCVMKKSYVLLCVLGGGGPRACLGCVCMRVCVCMCVCTCAHRPL